ncbi:hypothetical protein O7635_32260 [Asanoa sp. WMMD1127]|uniref:hypothetical protein n=1 Tax=Asanoa sp. WMMD1127 TaxID=3016107 RepID=UPI002415B877|nr:hypothetical protein [Asanoa sp. WMMD1127]MDG4826548.1 hypothetical protein [Asanoa sp. WMMD1127]
MGDRLVRWGLPRAANAVPLLMEFIVVAVATVLAIRFALFITGYPRLGGDGLHIAHVLWGGLLMAVGVMGLLSFNGRVIRPLGSFLAGVGFGLFIDEVGKFLTTDNDYFFTPSIAIMYVVIVLLVLGIHALHGRRPLSDRELYAAALTTAAAGVTNGMTDHSREMALRRLHAAGGLPGTDAATALVHQIPKGRAEKYDVSQMGTRVAARIARALRTRPAMIATIVVLLIQTVVTLAISLLIVAALLAREAGADVVLRFTDPVPTAVGGASALVSAACVVWGLVRLRQKRRVTGYRWLQRAVLIDLLLTRVFEFAVYQFAAIPALLIDLLLLAALEFAIRNAVREEAAADEGSAEAEEAGRRSPVGVGVGPGLGVAVPALSSGSAGSSAAPSLPRRGASPAMASMDGGVAVPSGAADVGPGGYPGPITAAGAAPEFATPSPPLGPPSRRLMEPAPGGRPLSAGPPPLGGPGSAPVVLPETGGGPAPYFASLPVGAYGHLLGAGHGSGDGVAPTFASLPVGAYGHLLGAGPRPAAGAAGGGAAGAGAAGAGAVGAGAAGAGAVGAGAAGAGAPGLGARVRAAFTGGCHSHAGVIGGATAVGCGAVAGGLVAGVSTQSAAAHGAEVATTESSGEDATEIVGEVLDESRAGDHDTVPPHDDASVPPPSADAGTRAPRDVGGQPPAATWVGSRRANAGERRYSRTSESTVDKRKLTPPPLS